MGDDESFFECRAVDASFFESARTRIVRTRDLGAPRSRVFATLGDAEAWPKFAAPGIAHVVWTTPGPLAVGAERTVTFPGGMKVFEHFFVVRPDEELAFHFTGATQRVFSAFAERYVLESRGDRTRLTWTIAYETCGAARLADPLAGLLGIGLDRMVLAGLDRYLRST